MLATGWFPESPAWPTLDSPQLPATLLLTGSQVGLLAGMEGPKDATTGETHPLDSSEAMMAGKFLTFWKQEDSQTKAIVIFFLHQKLQI